MCTQNLVVVSADDNILVFLCVQSDGQRHVLHVVLFNIYFVIVQEAAENKRLLRLFVARKKDRLFQELAFVKKSNLQGTEWC